MERWTSPAPLARRQWLMALAAGLGAGRTLAASAPARGPALTLRLADTDYLHRWSRQGQHEFTPADDADLDRWRDMVTLNVHPAVTQGDQLADVANRVLGNYQRHGKILQTRSAPRTATQPAQHLIVAVLGSPQVLEATFARCLLHDGTGLVAVRSHRIHGTAAGPAMSDWLRAHGARQEQDLMQWRALPSVAQLRALPSAA
jgi:hypothetical protein